MPGPLGPRQGRLDDQQVGVAGDLDELVAGAGSRRRRRSRRRRSRRRSDREGLDEVRHRVEARADIAPTSTRSPARRTPRCAKALSIRSSLPHAPTTRRKVSAAPGGAISRGRAGSSVPGPGVDRDGLLPRRVGQRVGVRDEVEEVVGVEVGDDDRVDLGVVDPLAQLAEHAVAAVEQDRRSRRSSTR